MDIELEKLAENPWSLEGQLRLIEAGIRVRPKRTARRGQQLAKLYEKVAAAESDLARAFNRWQKYRAQAARMEKRLDREFAEAAVAAEELEKGPG